MDKTEMALEISEVPWRDASIPHAEWRSGQGAEATVGTG